MPAVWFMKTLTKTFCYSNCLTKQNNPHSGIRCTADDRNRSFDRLAAKGLGKVACSVGRNNKTNKSFYKKSLDEIAKDAEILDRFPKSVSFLKYESNRKLDGRNSPSNTIEEKEDENEVEKEDEISN